MPESGTEFRSKLGTPEPRFAKPAHFHSAADGEPTTPTHTLKLWANAALPPAQEAAPGDQPFSFSLPTHAALESELPAPLVPSLESASAGAAAISADARNASRKSNVAKHHGRAAGAGRFAGGQASEEAYDDEHEPDASAALPLPTGGHGPFEGFDDSKFAVMCSLTSRSGESEGPAAEAEAQGQPSGAETAPAVLS